jgi:hypothetical protein
VLALAVLAVVIEGFGRTLPQDDRAFLVRFLRNVVDTLEDEGNKTLQ